MPCVIGVRGDLRVELLGSPLHPGVDQDRLGWPVWKIGQPISVRHWFSSLVSWGPIT